MPLQVAGPMTPPGSPPPGPAVAPARIPTAIRTGLGQKQESKDAPPNKSAGSVEGEIALARFGLTKTPLWHVPHLQEAELRLTSLTAMSKFESKSLEELRLEDYMIGKHRDPSQFNWSADMEIHSEQTQPKSFQLRAALHELQLYEKQCKLEGKSIRDAFASSYIKCHQDAGQHDIRSKFYPQRFGVEQFEFSVSMGAAFSSFSHEEMRMRDYVGMRSDGTESYLEQHKGRFSSTLIAPRVDDAGAAPVPKQNVVRQSPRSFKRCLKRSGEQTKRLLGVQ